VKHGETLTSIAAKRKGLSVADLAWLNDMTPDQPLAIGQQLRLPNQSYLDAGREARNKFVALSHYNSSRCPTTWIRMTEHCQPT
jgi:LysM repeat protein